MSIDNKIGEEKIFKFSGCNTLLNVEGHNLGNSWDRASTTGGSMDKPPKWVFGSLCNPTFQSSISFKHFNELDRHGSAVLRH
jgi:hypothetical protein